MREMLVENEGRVNAIIPAVSNIYSFFMVRREFDLIAMSCVLSHAHSR